jgi:hypothetical protein
MRRTRAIAAWAMVMTVAACGPVGAGPSATPGLPAGATSTPAAIAPSPSGPCGDAPCTAPPTAPAGGVVLIHATFTGHFSDPLSTADQTVEAEITWKTGPDSIHDMYAFTFTSGSFMFSESIGGVCGGTRSEAGPMNVQSGTALISGDPQDRDSAKAVMIDRRIEESLLEFSLFSQYGVPNADAEGCGPLSRSGVGSCSLTFPLVTLDRLREDASCDETGSSWTGHLEQR